MRRGELLHVRLKDVTLEDDVQDIFVDDNFPCTCAICRLNGNVRRTKTHEPRYVPLTPKAVSIVREQLARLEAEAIAGEWLFPVIAPRVYMRFKAGAQMDRGQIHEAMKAIAKAAGIVLPPRKALHFLRHWAITNWQHWGLLTEQQVKLASGHSFQGAQKQYTHGDRVKLSEAFRKL
jgi:integrase